MHVHAVAIATARPCLKAEAFFRETHLTGVARPPTLRVFKSYVLFVLVFFFLFLLEASSPTREPCDPSSSCLHIVPMSACPVSHVRLKMRLGEGGPLAARASVTRPVEALCQHVYPHSMARVLGLKLPVFCCLI